MHMKLTGWTGFVLFVVCVAGSFAQKTPESPITFRQLTRPAGYIFVGRVKSLEFLPARNSVHVASVRIRFQVEQGLRGVRSGRQLVVSEWAALWEAGDRYHTGERVLLFLYPKSKLGLTSPVGGARGRFALDRKGQILLGAERATLFSNLAGARVRERMPLREFVRSFRRLEEE